MTFDIRHSTLSLAPVPFDSNGSNGGFNTLANHLLQLQAHSHIHIVKAKLLFQNSKRGLTIGELTSLLETDPVCNDFERA